MGKMRRVFIAWGSYMKKKIWIKVLFLSLNLFFDLLTRSILGNWTENSKKTDWAENSKFFYENYYKACENYEQRQKQKGVMTLCG